MDIELYRCSNRVVLYEEESHVEILNPDHDNPERNYTHDVNKLNYNLITGAKESDLNDINASDKTLDDYVEHDAISETHKEYYTVKWFFRALVRLICFLVIHSWVSQEDK